MQTYIHIYTRRLLQANPHVGLHGKSQDVPGHLGTKGICLTWDLHVRYPQCESTVKRDATGAQHTIMLGLHESSEDIIAGRPPYHTYRRKAQPSNHSHYSAMIQLCTYMYVYIYMYMYMYTCIIFTVHVHAHSCLL